jgi:hypothetical protein
VRSCVKLQSPLPRIPLQSGRLLAGIRALDRLTQPRPLKGRILKGLNFFSRAEQTLLAALQRPGFNIAGLRRAELPLLCQSSPATLSRQLARLRHLGVIKPVLGTYRYYLTRAGRAAIAAGRRLTEHKSFLLWPDKSAHKMQTLRS